MQLAWGRKVSHEFALKVIKIAREIGCDPSDLMSCMAFESAETFSASVVNHVSRATGLIQFMPTTAKQMGTTVGALAELTAVQQLDYVARYFKPYRGKLHSIDDLYMAILWPKAVGKPSNFVLFDKHSPATTKAYAQNKGLDFNKDGEVTKAEAASQPRAKLRKGLQAAYVLEIDEDAPDVVRLPAPRPTAAPEADDGPETPIDPAPEADPDDINQIARRLTDMNYPAGVLNGKWGGKLAGAIAGFLNDRGSDIKPPTSEVEFVAVQHELRVAIMKAEGEGFKRPVSEARKNADPEVVKEVAPEVANQKRGFLATVWASILTFLYGVFQSVGGYLTSAWDWFTGNKDNLPDQAPNWLWSKVSNLPISFWLFLMAAVLGFVAFGLIRTVHKTIDDVRTGKR